MAGTFMKCIYKFEGEVDGDLSLDVGDVVHVTKVVSDAWYEGVLHGKTAQTGKNGQFPKAFVEETNDKAQVFDVAIAVSAFVGEQENDLSLNEGEVVVITEVIDENWAVGYTHGGHKGTFPRAFVKQISFEDNAMKNALQAAVPSFNESEETEEIEDETSTSTNENYVAVAPFAAQGDTELNLNKGDLVEVTSIFDDFWLEGKLDNGKAGMFPRTCIDFPEDKVDENIKIEEDNTAKSEDSRDSDVVDNIQTEDENIKIEEDDTAKSEKSRDSYVVAIFDYISSTDGDLNFRVGDQIKILEVIDENWSRGELSEAEGVFPSNHVEKVTGSGDELPRSISEPASTETDGFFEDESFPPPPSDDVLSDLEENISIHLDTTNKDTLKDPPIKQPVVKKQPPSRPATGPKKPSKPKPPAPSNKSSEHIEAAEKPKKKPAPERPKMPAIKKDTTPPFSYKFDTESQPLVIISGKYVKVDEPNVIILRRTLKA